MEKKVVIYLFFSFLGRLSRFFLVEVIRFHGLVDRVLDDLFLFGMFQIPLALPGKSGTMFCCLVFLGVVCVVCRFGVCAVYVCYDNMF